MWAGRASPPAPCWPPTPPAAPPAPAWSRSAPARPTPAPWAATGLGVCALASALATLARPRRGGAWLNRPGEAPFRGVRMFRTEEARAAAHQKAWEWLDQRAKPAPAP